MKKLLNLYEENVNLLDEKLFNLRVNLHVNFREEKLLNLRIEKCKFNNEKNCLI